MGYRIIDTYGVPQCGSETKEFEQWWELEEYIEETEGVSERIGNGYAFIEEC